MPICRPSEYGFVRDLWVEEDYRREGVGRKVMQAAIGRIRGAGNRADSSRDGRRQRACARILCLLRLASKRD